MQTRQLGTSGLELTTVGIGTWAIGGGDWAFGWGAQDEQEGIEGILAGVGAGVNWIDTAAIYGNGASEELVGKEEGHGREHDERGGHPAQGHANHRLARRRRRPSSERAWPATERPVRSAPASDRAVSATSS